ncbi:MAG: FAD-dependent oxidoreductase [Oligoflexia bacterium]|nr:FAD-dependent oxidoreductase [Oligoflexia bacterium]
MPVQKGLKATITKVVDLTPTVRELFFKPEKDFEFKAGQFIMLDIPHEGKIVQRAYSVASGDKGKSEFILVIKCYEHGVASRWVPTLKGGETVTFSGPFGKFLFKEPPSQQVVFVCTSTGLAPLYSMLVSQGVNHKNVDYKLYMGVWNEREVFYSRELEEAKKLVPNLQVHFVLDTASPEWKGLTGRVTQPISELDLTSKSTQFYICGNPAMIKSVRELLNSKNFPAAQVHTESYG